MQFSNEITAIIVAALSLTLPISILFVKGSIKRQRQSMIEDLELVYFGAESKAGLSPSFEFVKYKYSMGDSEEKKEKRGVADITWWEYLIAATPLCLIIFIIGIFAFDPNFAASFAKGYLPVVGGIGNYRLLWAVGFGGSYLYAMRTLLRSVENFDLKPLTFIAAAINIVFGTTAAFVAVLAGSSIFDLSGEAVGKISSMLVIAAFVIGYVPDLGLRTLLRFAKLASYKSEDYDVYKSFKTTPIEIIDGIDYNISDRLARFNINSVQSLATANPIMLFVEAPYGIFQVLDWVAQAQLCCVVGPKKIVELWRIGIRTIFDLERAVLHEDVGTRGPLSHSCLRMLMAESLFSKEQLAKIQNLPSVDGHAGCPPGSVVDDALKAMVRYSVDDLHVHRLRQVWLFILSKLDPEASKFT